MTTCIILQKDVKSGFALLVVILKFVFDFGDFLEVYGIFKCTWKSRKLAEVAFWSRLFVLLCVLAS